MSLGFAVPSGGGVPLVRALVLVLALPLILSLSGCLGGDSSSDLELVEYRVEVDTEGPATVYLPVLTEVPSGNVSDLVKELKLQSGSRNASLEVVETGRGKALKVETDGDVKFEVTRGSSYFDTHPHLERGVTMGERDAPIYLNFTMTQNGSTSGRSWSENRSEGLHWYYLESEEPVRIHLNAEVLNRYGEEYWRFNRELEPGWQSASMGRTVGVH